MYTIRQAADRAGITSELLRAWERRYGIVTPRRTPAGYRLYDDAAIARIRAMRSLVDDGWTPSAAASHLRELSDDQLPAPPLAAGPAPDTAPEDLARRFVDAAARMDGAGVQAFLDEIGARGSFETVADRYLFPALRALGRAWSDGTVSVAAEHAASSAVHHWLSARFHAAAANVQSDRPVLIGLPPGAHHELGTLGFATAARRAGLSVQYLGADLPAADWVRAARTTDASAAVIGVPTADDAAAARRVATALRRAVRGTPILFGGRGAAGLPRASVLDGPLGASAQDLRSRLERD